MAKNKINVALIGLGNFGKLIAGKLDDSKRCVLKYGFHKELIKAKKWDAKRGVADFNKLLEDSDIDAFFLTTPNHIRWEYIKPIIERRKHLYITKPLAHNLEIGLKIKKLADKYPKVKIMVGHNFRRRAAIRKAKEILDSGKIGKIVNVTINYSHGGVYDAIGRNEWKWRLDAKKHPEGPLMTVGVHLIDILHYLFGRISEVYCTWQNISGIGTAPDCNAVLAKMQNGATVFLQTNYNMPSERLITIHGTHGIIYINREEIFLRLGRDAGRVPTLPKKIEIHKNDPVSEELDEFLKSIILDKKIETGVKEGLNALTVVEACRKSHKTGRPVSLRGFKNYLI